MKVYVAAKRRITPCRALLGLAALAASLSLYACKSGSTTETDIDLSIPPVLKLDVKIRHQEPGPATYEGNAGVEHAGKCGRITWSGSDGADIQTDNVQVGSDGSVSGQIPAGAVRYHFRLAPCPPKPVRDDANGKMFDPYSLGQTPGQAPARIPLGAPVEYIIVSYPLHPSQTPGERNLTYAFRVLASSYEEADARIAPILAGGPGTPVSPGVEVLLYSYMESSVAGGRYVQAQPGSWTEWSLQFNGGAFEADLFGNAMTYQVGDWSVVETLIPLSAFDFSVLPGAQNMNRGTIRYRTSKMTESAVGSYRYHVVND